MKNYSLNINGQDYNVQIDNVNEASTLANVTVNGVGYEVNIAGISGSTTTSKPQVAAAPKTETASAPATTAAPVAAAPAPVRAAAPAGAGAVKSPLPGTVVAVKVAVGQQVTVGQTLVVLEAMKMENNIDADRAGVVTQIAAPQGTAVMEGDVLIVIE